MSGDWNRNKLSGNVGECIIRYLINSMDDWQCVKFGVEDTVKGLKEILNNSSDKIFLKIRRMPDFIAFNEKTKQILIIEVKYRSGKYFFKYLENYNEYWEGTKLILVRPSEPYFVYINLEDIDFSMRNMNNSNPYWNFEKIEKDIRELFPELKEEDIQEAIKMIPNKE